MNRLPREKRARILRLLVESVSMRGITRIEDVSINTVTKLLVDAGEACAEFHDRTVKELRPECVQLDELWSFIHTKRQHLDRAVNPPPGAGDCWTWVAMDIDAKLMISWHVGGRERADALALVTDLYDRLANRTQLMSDGLFSYPDAIDQVFGSEVDYGRVVKHYDSAGRYTGATKEPVTGNPNMNRVGTSYVERQNLSVRQGVRRFGRRTSGISKRLTNHRHHLAIWFVYYNWTRIHESLRVTPAMAAGLTETLYDVDWIVGLVEARTPPPGPRGPYKKHTRPNRRKRREQPS